MKTGFSWMWGKDGKGLMKKSRDVRLGFITAVWVNAHKV